VLTPQQSSDYPVFVVMDTNKDYAEQEKYLTWQDYDAPFLWTGGAEDEHNESQSNNEEFGEFVFL